MPSEDTDLMRMYYNIDGTKSLPIHCVIEQTTGPPSFDNYADDAVTAHTSVELDSYAILPGTTLLSECVHAALVKLGYTSVETMGAKGAIQIKNWKPLNFDAICESKSANIDDILGELTQVATLRIRICSPTKLSSAEEMKEKLLQLLLNQSHGLLAHSGCPIDKSLLASVSNGQSLSTISPEMRRAFDKWYSEQVKNFQGNNLNLALTAKDLLSPPQSASPKCRSPSEPQVSPPLPHPAASSTPAAVTTHPAFAQQYQLPGKTRMRTSFDPEHEIPRLHKWFVDNQHPSREHMIHFLNELNSLASRKGRRPLDLTNIIYWFKNARAAQRRATKNSFSGDDSFEMDDDREAQMASSEGLPFLPNRNAVYMVPYPLHPNMGQTTGVQNGHNDWREPCDLSMNSKSNSHTANSSPPAEDNENHTADSPKSAHELESNVTASQNEPVRVKVEEENTNEETAVIVDSEPVDIDNAIEKNIDVVEKDSDSDEKENDRLDKADLPPPPLPVEPSNKTFKLEANIITYQPKDLSYDQPKDLSVDRARDFSMSVPQDFSKERSVPTTNGMPRDVLNVNGKREYESDDDLESEDDDDDQSADGSHSSHEEDRMTKLHESYMNAARGLNFNPIANNPSGQPLHIPQFPHPLAMHYFPLNSHLYAQQANQMKYPTHHTPPHHTAKPGQGQENSSHRKRRTRVFIDPLSEIPKLEKWFIDDTHPSSYMIDKYCEELNSSEYRQKFPKLESKNVQLWFKNHRAKVKRMRVSTGDGHLPMFD